MANKYLIDLDLNGNEIQNFAIQTTGTLPSTPVNGQVVNHSGIIKVYDLASTTWKTIGAAADGTTITESSGVLSVGTIAISNTSGLQTALDGKVDDSQVLTNVPSGAVFTDTQLTQEQVEDYVGGLLTGSGATSVTYDDNANTLTISSTNTTYSAGNGVGLSGTTFSVAGGDGLTQESSGLKVDSTVVRTSGAQTIAGNKTFSNDVAINGDLTVSGNVTTKLSEEVLIEDNMVILNSNETGTPSENAGIEVERGTAANASLFWAESQDRWYMSDGTNTEAIPNAADIAAADTNDNDFLYNASFNTSNGELTMQVGAQSDVVVDLDGRYLTSYTETDPVFSASDAAGISSGDISNWDAAHGWGDHSQAGYLTAVPSAGIGAGTYGDAADGTKIDTITIDAQGRVTAVATGPVVDNNTQLTNEQVEDIVGGMLSGGVADGIDLSYDDNGSGAGKIDIQTSESTERTSVTQTTAGTYKLTSATASQDFSAGLPMIQVYELDGSNYEQVNTSVKYNGTSTDMEIYLPVGDFVIISQARRA